MPSTSAQLTWRIMGRTCSSVMSIRRLLRKWRRSPVQIIKQIPWVTETFQWNTHIRQQSRVALGILEDRRWGRRVCWVKKREEWFGGMGWMVTLTLHAKITKTKTWFIFQHCSFSKAIVQAVTSYHHFHGSWCLSPWLRDEENHFPRNGELHYFVNV